MFNSDELKNKLTYSHSIDSDQEIWIEWNMNQSYNISKVGNYRYRPGLGDPKFNTIRSIYEPEDAGGYYTGATDADTIINAGFDDSDNPVYHIAPKKKINLLYSLDDCFKQNRPRSGINKLLYLGISGNGAGYSQYVDSLNVFKSIKTKNITGASFEIYARDGNQLYDFYDPILYPSNIYPNYAPVSVIVYNCENDFSVDEQVKVDGIVVNGNALITIDSGNTVGTILNKNSVYEGQNVIGNNFSDGTYIASIADNSIIFSTPAINTLNEELISFTGLSSDFNFSTPKKIIDASPSHFVVETNSSEEILYGSGGSAIYGYLSTSNIARRPRYYMASRYDDFKYWTSYRTEVSNQITNEYGISVSRNTGTENKSYYIYDTAPFVVYNEEIPANRIVVKMQTNVGEINNGPYRINQATNISDPFYGEENKTVPKKWSIQILNDQNDWIFIKSFSETETREDGSPIIGSDGHVELEYGLDIPPEYKNYFTLVDEIFSESVLPDTAPYGYAYLLKNSDHDKGIIFISDGASWQRYDPKYSWKIKEDDITKTTSVVKKLSNPDYFIENDIDVYREFQFIKGIRIVVETMNKINSTFDLIELSPRLISNISNMVTDFSISKTLSDLGTNSIPTGNLIAATGSISIFDENLDFNVNNTFNKVDKTGSIVSKYSDTRMKFLFYDVVKNVNGFDYYIPIKTMYSERVPQIGDIPSNLSIQLRDTFYLFESKKAPEMLLTNVSLSYAITVLLDSIGFSNYIFKRTENDEELIIPYFFVGPEQNIAEALQGLAISSQSAMTFDEYNNFVVMSKNYLLPSQEERPTDMILYGQEEAIESNIALPNIINISSQEKEAFNDGVINYTTRYIQKSIGTIAQAPYVDEYKTFIYKPVLLWEIAGEDNVKTINESAQQSSGYALSAIPLKTTISANTPAYSNGQIQNNIMDFGEGIYWLGNYKGYFYANGEIIKYDAVEYAVAGVGIVWIQNNQQYQDYFSKLKFNGKMYPTGRVRIYTNVEDGVIKEHGRGQFGTNITEHIAGLPPSSVWINDSNVRGFVQNSGNYLFNTNPVVNYPETGLSEAGKTTIINGEIASSDSYALKSERNGIIKNFMANTTLTEKEVNSFSTALSGSVQTSSLIFNGPSLPIEINPADFITYSYKTMEDSSGNPLPFKHFGTRMRIIGKVESNNINNQNPINAYPIYQSGELLSTDPSKQISIRGGSGGIAFGLNKEKNLGYYFEIVALTQDNVSSFKNNSNIKTYSVAKSPVTQAELDTVTVTLNSQHDFEIGTKVSISGLIDDNRKTKPTYLNGEAVVTEISIDRKQFKYILKPPASTIANIASVSVSGSGPDFTITYTANNSFSRGQLVNISGLSPSAFNVTNATVMSSNQTSFTVSVSSDPGVPSDQTGTATYVPLTTLSSSGGNVVEILDSETTISNVFFYKIVSGSNTSDIIKKAQSGNVVTLTTLRDHKFVKGERVVVSGVDSTMNSPSGSSYEITEVGSQYFKYNISTSQTVAETELSSIGLATSTQVTAIPKILWRGLSEIIVDSGNFATQSRLTSSEKTTVYDLSAEYIDIGSTRKFYLYLNDKQIAVVTDIDPLPQYNNIALFVRGSSRVMFENVYALADNFGENQSRSLQLPVSKIFGDELITESDAIKKYSINGIVQNTYLSGISSESGPAYSIYYEEFGTIMREAAYFNIKYDRAYPALYAVLAKTINRVRGYSTSGFFAGSYGAEFIIFNTVDKLLNLDDTTGNYLRILGIAFTQNTTHALRVDDFFNKNSNFTNALYSGNSSDSQEYKELYTDILNSRNKYGRKDFVIDAPYVQTDSAAQSMMDWIIRKTINPRKTIGITTFATQNIQLGDIVEINYKDADGINIISLLNRYVVYSIEYSKTNQEINQKLYLAEV